MSSVQPAKINPWVIRLGVLAGWLFFMGMVVTISWGGTVVRERPFSFVSTVYWNLGWLLWAGTTFVVASLARRFPVERKNLLRGIAVHVLLGLAVVTLTQLTELTLSHAISRLSPIPLRPHVPIELVIYKFHIYFLIYWMILGATRAFDYYSRYRESELLATQLDAKLAQAQLSALKMQLQPHFLFNTHHSIISLMLKNENAPAIKMLTRLSDLLRITLKRSDQQVISLREEIEVLELYLGIQRERYRERLTVHVELEPGALDAEVPCLLLQQLVENALQHGIDARSTDGSLRVSARVSQDRLVLTVSDNGPGLPPDFSPDTGKGIGLRNTRARLERMYGRRHRFQIVAGRDGGTDVCVELALFKHVNEEVLGDPDASIETRKSHTLRMLHTLFDAAHVAKALAYAQDDPSFRPVSDQALLATLELALCCCPRGTDEWITGDPLRFSRILPRRRQELSRHRQLRP